MAREIERKFLLKGDGWKQLAFQQTHFAQGYLNDINDLTAKSSVRVRIEGDKANLNIKSLEIGLSRDEYEVHLPLEDAKKILASLTVGPVIEKIRYLVRYADHIWEVDEFLGDNAGLVVAEVEMETENDQVTLPDWAGREVTEEARFYNISLSKYPYKEWSEDEKK
jgi:adenylate cyclase